jgi:hypothetical protein
VEKMLEPVDQYITLERAAQLSGLSVWTLRNQARSRRSQPARLQAVKLGHDLLTTRRWLHEYLTTRDETRQQAAPLPADYQAPE